jgi:hypothetical protein
MTSVQNKIPSAFMSALSAGGERNGKKEVRWAVLDDESDNECPCPPPSTPVHPVLAALHRGDLLWGDINTDKTEDELRPWVPHDPEPDPETCLYVVPDTDAWASAESELWKQPFSENLENPYSSNYDLSRMSEEHYRSFMKWIYQHGFYVEEFGRHGCYATPIGAGARSWPVCEPASATTTTASAAPRLSAPGTDAGRRRAAPVPKFCKDGKKCKKAGCEYVHGDTIRKVPKPCGFGAACGASDPTGVKRKQCLYMHPGETWTPESVIHRL